ncbi:MAG: hypothetical protein R2862_01610 [Thermoanaerobaculia bacterium]
MNVQPFWVTAEWAQKRFHVSSAAGAGTLAIGALPASPSIAGDARSSGA